MVALITDPVLEEQLIEQRRDAGADRYDEVWEGVYVMAPLANNQHQALVKELTTVMTIAVDWTGLGQVFPGVNVSDRKVKWKQNYRCPDVVVFLKGTDAADCGTHWFGGPDFAIEIVSPNDRTLEKLPFYASVGTRELLVIERDPWAMRLFGLKEDTMVETANSSPENKAAIASALIPLTWQLLLTEKQPAIEITHHDGVQKWLVKTQP